jgi:hypothetical protein
MNPEVSVEIAAAKPFDLRGRLLGEAVGQSATYYQFGLCHL